VSFQEKAKEEDHTDLILNPAFWRSSRITLSLTAISSVAEMWNCSRTSSGRLVSMMSASSVGGPSSS
jgi:hypothetical protein